MLAQDGSKSHIAKHLGISRRTVIRWAQSIEKCGSLETFLDENQRSKKGPRKKRKTEALLKRRIWAIRERHHGCCGQKIQYFLEKEYGVRVSVTTIYKVLSEKYELRSKWKKNQKRGPVPHAQAPREVIQMDTVDFDSVFAFTAVDNMRAMSCCALPWEQWMAKPFCITVCSGGLVASPTPFKPMAAVSSKGSSRTQYPTTVCAIDLLGRPRRMSKHLSRASIGHCGKSVWDGRSMLWQKSHY